MLPTVSWGIVTILILIDGFLQLIGFGELLKESYISHNPYFNRWFSAIPDGLIDVLNAQKVTILILIDGFLQWDIKTFKELYKGSHNPYFNRWFSAIIKRAIDETNSY